MMSVWESGRQGGGYLKKTILDIKFPFRMDMHYLLIPEGCSIPLHRDPLPPGEDGEHFRLNIVLKQPEQGGEFICESPIFNLPRIKFFRPDIDTHGVSVVEKGERLVLSIGWIRREL